MKAEPEKEDKTEVESLIDTLEEWHRSLLWASILFLPGWGVFWFFGDDSLISLKSVIIAAIGCWLLARFFKRLSRVMREIRLSLMAANIKADIAQSDLEELKAKIHE